MPDPFARPHNGNLGSMESQKPITFTVRRHFMRAQKARMLSLAQVERENACALFVRAHNGNLSSMESQKPITFTVRRHFMRAQKTRMLSLAQVERENACAILLRALTMGIWVQWNLESQLTLVL